MKNSNIPSKIGNLQIIKLIGEGQYTSVYLAYSEAKKKEFALKFYRGPYVSDPMFRRRFEREANIVQKISHANLVHYYSVEKTEDNLFIVMDYIDGPSLKNLLVLHKRAPLEVAVAVMEQLLTGLAYLHNLGVVHRDIKPSALFLENNGKVVLADFDIAKSFDSDSLTNKGVPVGSPRYMSPEQRLGSPVTPKSDIFASGIVFYEMLMGKTPWQNSNVLPTDRRAWAEMVLPSNEIPNIPRYVDEVISQAIDLQPGRRYSSVNEMISAIQELPSASRNDLAAWASGRIISYTKSRIRSTNLNSNIKKNTMSSSRKQNKSDQKTTRILLSIIIILMLVILVMLIWVASNMFLIN